MIELANVTLSHRGLPVLREASFTVEAGEIVLLSGDTGSGKTSMMRALYGDLPVDTGRIVIDGVDITRLSRTALPEIRRRMGLIFQDDKLLEDRSVYDNIRFALSIQMDSPRQITRRAMEILAELGLSHLRSLMPKNLSGGEAQRIGVARALANSPRIVLADEPTGDLDPATAVEIFRYLSGRHTPSRAFIISTHDLARAVEVFPHARRLHLSGGTIRELGRD
jgi:cell division transport system ATP-binding protein